LTPYDRTVCFIAGKLAVEGNDWDQSVEAFKRCTALGGFDNEIIDTYVDAGRPELAVQIVAGRRQELEYLAGRLQGIARYRDIADACQNEATSLLLAEANAPGASAEVLADLAARYAQQNKPADAIQWYQKALGLNYGEVDWRLNLAGIMAATGRVSDAMEEAKICIRLRPQCDEARKMIGDLSLRSDADRDTGAAAGANLASDAALQGSPTR
jgi:tetratricopeptide (TPR) repeat protein